MGTEEIIFRDGQAVAITNDALKWFLDHTPQSMDWALRHEGYRVGDVDSVKLCATCMRLVESGEAVPVLVTTNDKENPVTVYKHPACAHPPRNYSRDPYEVTRELVAKMRNWDASKPRQADPIEGE